MSDIGVYTIYSNEDEELKGVFASFRLAENWIELNRFGNKEDCKIEYWIVQKEVKE